MDDLDFEQLKIEWQNQHFEGYLFETPRDQISADTRKRYEARCRRYRLRNYACFALLFVVAAGTAIGFYGVPSTAARIALLVVMPAVFYELLVMVKWRADEFKKPLYLPARPFLAGERARVLRRIRQTKWQMAWYAVMSVVGFTYSFLWSRTPDLGTVVDFLIGCLVVLLGIHILVLFDRKTDLRMELIRVEQHLKRIDKFNEQAGAAERE